MKTLVVYYSLGGNTRAVARRIARALKADVLEIRTTKTYPDDVDVLHGLAQQEVKTGYIPQLHPYRVDFDKYDAIVLGTPVWWSTFAPAMKTFMKGKDWKGRKVFPFTTNGTTIGHTPSDFRKALKGAEVAPILSVQFEDRVQVTPENIVKAWLELIG
ncbi:MAG: NAD(P)H-dependent oxidoreductase [Clostridia bacterium]|nr:NAD(P)H-dependent oxidoreductase [Clostridia bacterium]